MRSHAKASSAGSNKGAERSRRASIAIFSLAAGVLALALLTPSAFASKQVTRNFGTVAETTSFGGELSNPRDVAVNGTGVGPASTGDTFVADEGNNRIERFDASGNFVSTWGKDTISSQINERQRIVVKADSGSYTLSFDGSTTAPISFSTGSFEIQNELAGLPSVGGEANVSVSGEGTAGRPFVVVFEGALGGIDQPTITADASQLNGTVEISTVLNGSSSVPDDTGSGFEVCTVIIECQAGTASGENGGLDHPQSVAVDQDTGNVYVSDRGNRRVDEYDGEGNFIRAFGFDVAESGPGDTGSGYEVCNEEDGDTCKSGEAGSGVGQYGEGFAEDGFGIAVSPADASASTGTVYLADSGNRRVDTFDLDGTSPSSFGSSTNFGEEQPRSVAVDSRGIVYASDSNNGGDIQRYDSENADGGGVGFLAPIVPPNNEQQEITFTDFSTGDDFKLTCPDGKPTAELAYVAGAEGLTVIKTGLEEACGAHNFSFSGETPNVTVTFEGTLGAAGQPQMTCTVLGGTGSCSVATISNGRAGPLLRGEEASSATAGLAVNSAGTALYVLRRPFPEPEVEQSTVVQQFGPTSEPGLSAAPTAVDDTHGATARFGLATQRVQGFGFDEASSSLFVSTGRVFVLSDSSSLPAPTASMPSAGAVTTITDRGATFNGTVDPKGGLVSCKFQDSTDGTNWKDIIYPGTETARDPGCGELSENGGEQNVSQEVSGLAPDTHYFVRLQVTRPYFPDFTPVISNEASFTTATGAPLVSGVSAKALDDHSVHISATLDPGHSPTTYVVQYGTTPGLDSSTVPVSAGAGSTPLEVSPVIGGLDPATQYYFKLVATSLVGSAASEVLTITTFPSTPSFGSCPNDLFRTGQSAKLPDCRAYEQATPTDKFGSDANGTAGTVEVSPNGDGVTFYTLGGFPASEGFQEELVFLSRFTAGSWSTAGLQTPPRFGDKARVVAWTPDLHLSFVKARITGGTGGSNLVIRDNADGSYAIAVPQGAGFSDFTLGAAFDGDSKVVFTVSGNAPVTAGPGPVSSAGNVYLYDRVTGDLTLVGLLPDSACGNPPCVPAEGSDLPAAFEGDVQDGHAVSLDGDVYFTDRETGQLYLRRDAAGPSATTVQVAASERTEPDPAGTSVPTFMGATPDGAHAFFKSGQKLTDDSIAMAGAEDLYRFDANADAGQRLTDIAPGAEPVGMLGYSDGGDYVYFAANGDLDGAGPATAGNCAGSANNVVFSGACSVYLWKAAGIDACASASGCLSFIARADANHSESDAYNWVSVEGAGSKTVKASRLSADGRTLVFRSQLELTDYDNTPPDGVCGREFPSEKPIPCPEFYRYDAESGQISCLTCDPTGAPPTGAPALKNPDTFHANSVHFTPSAQAFLSRNLSPDGKRFFFQTADKLVPADVNGDQACPAGPDPETGTAGESSACTDVYEWEAPGKGTCTAASGAYSPASGGCIYLLSTGTGPYPSYLADVSESGDTAFIFSRQKLVPSDEDNLADIYAVKSGGGLAYQHAARPANCEGDACRGASSQPSNAPGAGSGVFEGPGNPPQSTNKTRCPKGKKTIHSKGKVRCVAKKHRKKAHKSKSKAHKRAANNDRRASR